MKLAFAAAAAIIAAPGSAATYVVSTTFDVSQYEYPDRVANTLPLSAPISGVAAGDTIDLTVNFTQSLTYTRAPGYPFGGYLLVGLVVDPAGPEWFGPYLGDVTFELGGAAGDFIASGTGVDAGPYYGNTPMIKVADPASFTGGSFSSVTLHYQVSTPFADQITHATFASSIPEPATWALLIGGFGAAGCSLRRGRRSSTALALEPLRRRT